MMIGVNGVRLSGGSLGLSGLGGLATTTHVEQVKKGNSRAGSFDSSSKANVPGNEMALELVEDLIISIIKNIFH